MTFDLRKPQYLWNDHKSWIFMPQNIQKVVLHNIIAYLKTNWDITFIRFHGRFGRHFEFDLYMSAEVTPILFAMDFENTLPIPTMANFKNLSIVLNSPLASTKLRIMTLLYKPIDFNRL